MKPAHKPQTNGAITSMPITTKPFKDGDPLVTALIGEVDRAVKQSARDGGPYDTIIRHILNEHLTEPGVNKLTSMTSLTFTHDCSGDLGCSRNGQVMAMMFERSDLPRYAAHDILKGGLPTLYSTLANALNAMIAIVEEIR